MFFINNAVFILCREFYFLKHFMLPTHLAKLLVLQLLRHELLIL